LIELQNIAIPYAPFPPSIPGEHHRRATIYSWALNNIWDTNFPPQQRGELVFRYAIGSSGTDDRRTLGIETAATMMSPPSGICLRPGSGPEAPARHSLLSVSNPLVEIVKVESTGDGTLRAHLLSLAEAPVSVQVAASGLRPAMTGTFLGEQMRPLVSGSLELHPGDYVTVELVSA
jgi:hypothetical protein